VGRACRLAREALNCYLARRAQPKRPHFAFLTEAADTDRRRLTRGFFDASARTPVLPGTDTCRLTFRPSETYAETRMPFGRALKGLNRPRFAEGPVLAF
jgi:hypothetical protein